MEILEYKTEVFEGPLDLLLSFISKRKVDILDIPILEIVDQYLEYLAKLEDNKAIISAEFLEMAARLIYIKTVSLLPKDEEAEILTKELKGELIRYRDCKIVAEQLKNRTSGFDYLIHEKIPFNAEIDYKEDLDIQKLFSAALCLSKIANKKKPLKIEVFDNYVHHKTVPVQKMIDKILNMLQEKKGKIGFRSFVTKNSSKSELIATFLAILELAHDNKIYIDGKDEDFSIDFSRRGASER
ncbi:MAG: segregation/condensation protein A [Clostridia bacterium]|nr:segregation/condensation protein A [Clostridia bacterium]